MPPAKKPLPPKSDPEYHFEALKGLKTEIDTGDAKATLVLGKLARRQEARLEGEGFGLVMGEIVTKTGHHFHAVIELCIEDSCEHYGSIVYYLDDNTVRTAEQSTPSWNEWVAKMKATSPDFEPFPYKYRYRNTDLRHGDHHVGDDGWSIH